MSTISEERTAYFDLVSRIGTVKDLSIEKKGMNKDKTIFPDVIERVKEAFLGTERLSSREFFGMKDQDQLDAFRNGLKIIKSFASPAQSSSALKTLREIYYLAVKKSNPINIERLKMMGAVNLTNSKS